MLVNLRVLRVKVGGRRGARRRVFIIGGWPLLLLGTWTITTFAALTTPTTLFSRVIRIIISDVVPLKLPLP